MSFTPTFNNEERQKFKEHSDFIEERLKQINPEISHVEIFRFISGINDIDPTIPWEVCVEIHHKDRSVKCVYFPLKDFPDQLYSATYNQYLRLVAPEAVRKQDNTPISLGKSVWLGDFLES